MIKFLLRLIVGGLATINIAQADIIYHWVPSAPLTTKGDVWITGGEITISDDIFGTTLDDGYLIGSSTPPISFSIDLSSTNMGDSIVSGDASSLVFPYTTDVPLQDAALVVSNLNFGAEIIPVIPPSTSSATPPLIGISMINNVDDPEYSFLISPILTTEGSMEGMAVVIEYPDGSSFSGGSFGYFAVPEPSTLLLFSLGFFGFITLLKQKSI
ncbi:PEP-CTERM sorting domain-containing protein [Candidatus Nitrosacidococcus tergens]|uniref:Ice-binding protein C-terminal domain-containing protein n=1 Tax=Candidatus Nitrosacidococcus tergens TaxID=553981 RepID=A0A7G1QBS6_9GAMM|nr:PEP-CTERM sorting domain-containing protein [Candidatus Nitrosacidococcus tergens]CAB1276857.1 protein of unknown function [Candidatus Nitrosacidococcus tergens]